VVRSDLVEIYSDAIAGDCHRGRVSGIGPQMDRVSGVADVGHHRIMDRKGIISYPFVWRAYDWGSELENNPMIGLRGIAKDRLNPSGYISVHGELWKAKVIEGGSSLKKERL